MRDDFVFRMAEPADWERPGGRHDDRPTGSKGPVFRMIETSGPRPAARSEPILRVVPLQVLT